MLHEKLHEKLHESCKASRFSASKVLRSTAARSSKFKFPIFREKIEQPTKKNQKSTNRHKVAQNGTFRHKVAQNGTFRHKTAQKSTKWPKVAQTSTFWPKNVILFCLTFSPKMETLVLLGSDLMPGVRFSGTLPLVPESGWPGCLVLRTANGARWCQFRRLAGGTTATQSATTDRNRHHQPPPNLLNQTDTTDRNPIC
jgi:hypothetical protein